MIKQVLLVSGNLRKSSPFLQLQRRSRSVVVSKQISHFEFGRKLTSITDFKNMQLGLFIKFTPAFWHFQRGRLKCEMIS